MIILEGNTYKINNLPSHYDSSMTFPLQILSLNLDQSNNILGIQDTLTLTVNEASLPMDIVFNIYDSVTETEFNLNETEYIPIITDSLGIISYEDSGPLNKYLNYGDHRYFVSVAYSSLAKDHNDIYPISYQLFQNYPNPFNPITNIDYELPRMELVTLKIFDIIGREVVSLINEIQKPGTKSVIWDATNNYGHSVSAGMYLYTIQIGNFRQTKKMVILK